MARLEHPHIVPIYEIGEQEGRLFLVMRLINGPDLTEHIKEKGRLPWDEVIEIVTQIASALDFAHAQNVIHRDLKPGNILISSGQALLTDFGLAQLMSGNSYSISVSGGIAGTYNYMPPEIFKDEEATPAADIYALGCVIYEMLAGKMLFDGKTTAAIIGAHLEGVTFDEPIADAPPGTREILQTALAKDPLQRYATAGELAFDLQRAIADNLNASYVQLEERIAGGQWAEALALAAEIRDQDPNYRDVVALEQKAQQGRWSAQRQAEAEQALAADDFSAVRGALLQWRRVDPDNPALQNMEAELALAEAYMALQGLIAEEKWEEAVDAAHEIYVQDPDFRDIVQAQVLIRNNLSPLSQSNPPAKAGLPPWIGWIGAGAGLLILILGIRAAFFVGDGAAGDTSDSSDGQGAPIVEGGRNNGGLTEPTQTPTQEISSTPGIEPTAAPTELPTKEPTAAPTAEPRLPPPNQSLGSVWVRPIDQMPMVYVPAGSFMMGSAEGERDEEPVHEVTLDGFWIDQTEVTNDQFRQFVAGTGFETTAEKEGSGWIVSWRFLGSNRWG